MTTDDEKEFLAATQAFENGDYSLAFDLFSQQAERGESWAQDYLGIMYGAGLGVKKDDCKSLMYHKLAYATSKTAIECHNIGRQYEIMGNRRRAFYWWRKAFDKGDKSAALEIAKLLLERPRRASRKRAIALLHIAAGAQPRLEISEAEIEEAQELLADLASGQLSKSWKSHWFNVCATDEASTAVSVGESIR